MSSEFMLSTKDNPFNPWTEWDEWFQWDTQEMYNSLALLDRVVRSSDELSDQLQEQAYDDAVDTIVTENVSGVHIKVAKPVSS